MVFIFSLPYIIVSGTLECGVGLFYFALLSIKDIKAVWIQTITSLSHLFHDGLKHVPTYEARAMVSIKLIGFKEQNMCNSPS